MWNGVAAMENELVIAQKVKHGIITWPSNFTPMCKRIETGVQTGTCIWMFIIALLIKSERGKQPKCPWTGGWKNKSWYVHAVE